MLEQALKKLVAIIRTNDGRKENTSFCIIDAQSVKNTYTAEIKDMRLVRKYQSLNVILQ